MSAALLRTHLPAGRFVARWGAEMVVEEHDMLAAPCAPAPAASRPREVGEVYRIARSMFLETYTRVGSVLGVGNLTS